MDLILTRGVVAPCPIKEVLFVCVCDGGGDEPGEGGGHEDYGVLAHVNSDVLRLEHALWFGRKMDFLKKHFVLIKAINCGKV